jgi:manganese/zinc/iron transport system permease protein
MATILALNLAVVVLFYKELKLATVDAGLAASLGFSPVILHYGLMTTVSVTAVGAFNAVGSILVVALMIAPPATAYLLVERFKPMLLLSVLIAAATAVAGYGAAWLVDVSIAGSMATACGVVFAAAFLFAPQRGIVAQMSRRKAQRIDFGVSMLLVHLLHHEGSAVAVEENRLETLHRHLRWAERHTLQVIRAADRRALVARAGELLELTPEGRIRAQRDVVR